MRRIGYAATSSNQQTDSRFVPVKALRPGHSVTSGNLEEALDRTLIGQSELMQALKKSIRLVANSAETVLITGESGTGKELIARAVHDLSSRWSQPFLAVNCGSLTESLLESELFGHVKGSFTGATANKKGFFEAASDGTIFLDEFAEMSTATQSRLLRVLEERTVRPVGLTGAREIAVSARVIVATNHDLKHDISMGKFRHDLYYRVNVLQIRAPALRDRRNDILTLAQHFLRKHNERNGRQISEQIAPEVLAHLKAYSWPGNVRELENIVNRLATNLVENSALTASDLLSDPELNQRNLKWFRDVESAQPQHRHSSQIESTGGSVESLGHCQCRSCEELDRCTRVLEQVNGNLAEVARQMNIPRTTLQSRLMRLRDRCGLCGKVHSLGHCQRRSRTEINRYIRLLSDVNGNIAEAARRLKIPRTTLNNRLMRLGGKRVLSGA